jgi:zinc/manganese transport system substrate-binding protein
MPADKNRALRALGFSAAAVVAFCLAVVLAFVGAANPGGKPTTASQQETLRVVSSVQVWADIAQSLGGKYVNATAIINSPNRDPHSYEATVRDQLAVNRADLTFTNGGDYDPFFAQLVAKKPSPEATQSTVLAQLPGASATNPHFWYDLATVRTVVDEISRLELAALGTPGADAEVTKRTAAYQGKLAALIKAQASTKTATAGKSVLLTEGFAANLLTHLGITNLTPREFLNAVEEEQDASPKVMRQLQLSLESGKVSALILNRQTEGRQTAQLISWAKASGVPVLRLSELLPTGQHYLSWMKSNLNAIKKAVK